MNHNIDFKNYLLSDEAEKGGLRKRSEIDEKYTWNLLDIYNSEDDWEADYKSIASSIEEYKKYEGKIGESSSSLLNLLKFDEEVGTKYDRLHLYSFLSKDLDLANTKYQSMAGRLQTLGVKLSRATAFIRPELIAIGHVKIKQYMSESE